MTNPAKSRLLFGLVACWLAILTTRWVMSGPEHSLLHINSTPRMEAKVGQDEFRVKSPIRRRHDIRSNSAKNIFSMSDGQQKPLRSVQSRASSARANLPTVPVPRPLIAPPSLPPSPQVPSLDELAAAAARQLEESLIRQAKDSMAQYRYLGYVYRSGSNQAFLGKGNEIHILQEGDILEGRFLVGAINATNVILREGKTNVEGLIELDKEQSAKPL